MVSLTNNQKVRTCTFLISKRLKWFDFCGFLTTVDQALASLTSYRKLFQYKIFTQYLYGVYQVAWSQQCLSASFPVFWSAGHSYPNPQVSCWVSTYCAWSLVIQRKECDPYSEGTCMQSCGRATRTMKQLTCQNWLFLEKDCEIIFVALFLHFNTRESWYL